MNVARLHENAILPTRGSDQAAGLDLYACLDSSVTIGSGDRAVVPTHVAMEIPLGCYGRVAPRSGLAVRYGIDVGAGVIDSDYRNGIGVVLFNHGRQDYVVNHGDRIAQLIVTPYKYVDVVEVDKEQLKETARGLNGFGSTGK